MSNIQRKYEYSLGELVDILSIAQMKQVYNPELKEQYKKEIDDLVDDIQLVIAKHPQPQITAKFLRDIIVITLYNHLIWVNEDSERKADMNEEDINWEKRYKQLRLTHSLNGIRNKAKNKISSLVNGRVEHKNQCLASEDAGQWTPSGY